MTMEGPGRVLAIVGLIMGIVGLLFVCGDRMPWLGKLPGDVYLEGENFRLYFPLTSSLLVSLLLSLLLGWFGNL